MSDNDTCVVESKEPPKELSFSVFYLAKKTDYQSEEVLGLANGPFISQEEAISFGRKKYGWGLSDYCVVVSEQKFQIAKMRIGN